MKKYRVVIEPDEDDVYVVEVPSLPGCISQGRTCAKAIDSAIATAIVLYLLHIGIDIFCEWSAPSNA